VAIHGVAGQALDAAEERPPIFNRPEGVVEEDARAALPRTALERQCDEVNPPAGSVSWLGKNRS
jgi:hypothetical protein